MLYSNQTAHTKMNESHLNPSRGGQRVIKDEVSGQNTMATKPHRSYDRTWEEIELMLTQATEKMIQWKDWYESCKQEDDKEGMKEAARNHKALQGVVKTLKWTLGEEGITDPLN